MKSPDIHPSVKIAPGAHVIGNARLESDVNIWHNAVVRADLEPIVIGEGTNVQDCSVLHVSSGAPLTLGRGVTIGHGAIVHGCTVGDNTLVGMGAIIMDHAVIGKNCIVAAGALVLENTIVPDCSLVMGSPAKVKRETNPEQWESNRQNAIHYIEKSASDL